MKLTYTLFKMTDVQKRASTLQFRIVKLIDVENSKHKASCLTTGKLQTKLILT